MRVFQEEIFGPVVALTSFGDEADALKVANDTLYGLGAGVVARRDGVPDGSWHQGGACGRTAITPTPLTLPSAVQGVGIGRENHKMMLDHYQQTKNLLVSYSQDAQGFF